MDIELVVFDFDGTLCDTRSIIVATMRQTLSELNLPERSEDECAATIGLPLKECFRQLIPQLGDEDIQRCADSYRRIFEVNKPQYKPVLFPKVRETLFWLYGHGIRMAVASSRNSMSLHDLLNDLDIAGFFDYVVGADMVAHPKPDPEPVLQILKRMVVDASRTLVVGDMDVDILMGGRAGCKTCGVTYGNGTREELEEAGADFVIGSIGYLQTLNGDLDFQLKRI